MTIKPIFRASEVEVVMKQFISVSEGLSSLNLTENCVASLQRNGHRGLPAITTTDNKLSSVVFAEIAAAVWSQRGR